MGNDAETKHHKPGAVPRHVDNEPTTPAGPGKATRVNTTVTARPITGVDVVDAAEERTTRPAKPGNWLSPIGRNTLEDQVYIFIKQAMDNGCDAAQNVSLDLLQNQKHSSWNGWKELGWRIVSNMLIGALTGGWGNFLAQAPLLLGERAAALVGVLTIDRVKGALVSGSTALRTVFAHAPASDDDTTRSIAYVRQEYQPAFGNVVLALTTGPLAARFTDAELIGLQHVYGDGRGAFSIAAWEAHIRAGLKQFNDSQIDRIGKRYGSKEISRKDSMTSVMTSWSGDCMMTFRSPQDHTHRSAVVNKEDDGGRIRWVSWIPEENYELALKWQLERNFTPPEVREAKGSGDATIDAWGQLSVGPASPNPDMTATPIADGDGDGDVRQAGAS